MAKVTFRRFPTDAEAQASNIVDGQFIVSKEGTSYIDYDTDRIPTNGTRDNAMSDNSQNAVQNKVIKEYADNIFVRDNIYSTSEKIVGTWINNKPIYRKTIFISQFPEYTASETEGDYCGMKAYDTGITNMGVPINMYGMYYDKSNVEGTFLINNNYNYRGTDRTINTRLRNDGMKITITYGRHDFSNYAGYVVLEYTKTTD